MTKAPISKAKPSFTRLFLSGFALGAVALVSTQVAHADDASVTPAAYAATR